MIVILDIVLGLAALLAWSIMLYNPYFKRFWDIVLSALGIIVLSPLMLVLTVLGAFKMKGNPFFCHMRPGKKRPDGNETIFKLIKFRSMTNARDSYGNLLPDAKRLTGYGRFLRSTSLDELPELINVLLGDMSIVGPRPLEVYFLPYYTEREHHRHDVLPGMTGLAQINGRNSLTWEEKFSFDLEYIESISLINDLKIIIMTVKKVLSRDDVVVEGGSVLVDFNVSRDAKLKDKEVDETY